MPYIKWGHINENALFHFQRCSSEMFIQMRDLLEVLQKKSSIYKCKRNVIS